MSFTNCENMTTYATNEYALNTSVSKFQKGNYTLYKHITSIASYVVCCYSECISHTRQAEKSA